MLPRLEQRVDAVEKQLASLRGRLRRTRIVAFVAAFAAVALLAALLVTLLRPRSRLVLDD